jgi:nicotinate phosphoribosyltransferase
MAHEYLQTYQALGVRLRDSRRPRSKPGCRNTAATWVALTDVVGMDAFLADFDLYFAKLFDGLRHDSGDPVVWGEKALAHYEQAAHRRPHQAAGVQRRAGHAHRLRLYRHFADRTQLGFGIGTNLSNDMGLHRCTS